MAAIKLLSITPNQKSAMQSLCDLSPEKYSIAPSEGYGAARFNFPIEDLAIVYEYLRRAGNGRAVSLYNVDLSEEIAEFDWAWSTQNDHLVFRNVEIYLGNQTTALKAKHMKFDLCAEILDSAGAPELKGDEEFYLNEYPEAKYILLAAFLIANPFYLVEDESWDVETEVETLVKNLAKAGQLAEAA